MLIAIILSKVVFISIYFIYSIWRVGSNLWQYAMRICVLLSIIVFFSFFYSFSAEFDIKQALSVF